MSQPEHHAFGLAVVTLFPEIFDSFFGASLIGRALAAGLLSEHRVDPREFTEDVHRTVDDAPYGGGAGMIMKPEPLAAAIEKARRLAPPGSPCVLLTPQGRPFHQALAADYARRPGLVLVCGRYEGIDDRVRQTLVEDTLSVGDYVLSGGEVAAMTVVEAVTRLVPGVLGNDESSRDESFSIGTLEYPQYTRPAVWNGCEVPEILRSGDHAKIRDWRRAQALWRTREVRPELFERLALTAEDRALMEAHPRAWSKSDLP